MRFEEKFKRQCRADRQSPRTERSYWHVARRFILWVAAGAVAAIAGLMAVMAFLHEMGWWI